MKRWMKKGIAAVLACSVLIGNYGIGHAKEAAGDGTDGNTATLLTDAVYDEAVALGSNVAFLENGHWPTEEYHYDPSTGKYVVDKQETNITSETKIVFMDAKGSKKEISNKDSKGEQMFEVVFPSVSSTWYRLLKVLKDDKASYIRPDGTFFGDELAYYGYVEPVTNDFILVSDDGKTYRAVNSKGAVTADNLKVTEFGWYTLDVGYNINYSRNDVAILACDDKTVVFDAKGNVIKEYDENVSMKYSGYGYMQLKDGTKTQLLDLNGTVLREFDPDISLGLSYAQKGYVTASKTEYTETETGPTSQTVVQLVNIKTGEVVYTGYRGYTFGTYYSGITSFDGEIIVGRNQDGTISALNTDGTVYIADMEQFVKDLGAEEGYKSSCLSLSANIVDGTLLLSSLMSFVGESMSYSEARTYILTKENGFAADGAKKVNGTVVRISNDGKYFTTVNNGYLQNLYTIEGELLQDLEEKNIYSYSCYAIDGQIDSDKLIFYVSTTGGYAYITADGKISSETFRTLRKYGNFLAAQKDKSMEVWNSSGKLVYRNEEAISEDGYSPTITIDVFSNYGYDCFSVKEQTSGKAYLYNGEGEIIFGGEGAYSAIGTAGSASGGHWTSSWYYWYNNYPLSNGLCIIEKTEGNTTKYGAIVLNGKKAEGHTSIGDVNGDDKINTSDALMVLKYVATLIDLDDNAKKLADVNGDTKVNTSDALDILKYVATLIDHFGAVG